MPQRSASLLASFFPGLLAHTVGPLVANPEQMDRRHIRELARVAVTDLPAPLLTQFADWYSDPSGFRRADGLFEYHEHLHRIRRPILIIAGAADALTPVDDLRDIAARISSPDKRLLICGREQGFRFDYGHIDLILGRHARDEVYPHIAAWIESHAA